MPGPEAHGDAADPVRSWLEPRLREVPPDLAAAVRGAVDRVLAAGAETGDPGPDAGAGDPRDEGRPVGWDGSDRADSIGPVAGVLVRAAVGELDRVAGMQGRRAALALLAADASLTYAFEAAVDDGTDPMLLAELTGPRGAIGRRLTAVDGPDGP